MFFFFIFFINGKLLIFNNKLVTKGFQIQRSIDTVGLSFISNLEVSNCTNNADCKLDIIYYRNNDTSKIFTNYKSDKAFDVCCNDIDAKENKCKSNSINLQKDSPYTHVEYLQSDSMKFVTIPSASEDIWTVLVTACISNETSFLLNGYIDYKPNFSNYIDERVKKISIFCLRSCISCLVFIICYMIAQKKYNPQATPIQNSFYFVLFCSCISDLFIYLFSDFYNKNSIPLYYLILYSSLFRTVSRTLLLKITYDGLQFPNLISNFVIIPLFSILCVSFLYELTGVRDITLRISGDWFFGYGNPLTSLMLFLSIIFVTIYILYCSIYKIKNITSTGKRRKFIYLITLNAIIYAILTFLFILIRRNKSLVFTRNLDLFTFCIEPLNFYILAAINSWYLFIFNAQGWEQITNDQNTNSLDVGVDSLNNEENKPSLVGNGYRLPSSMLNKKTEFVIDNDEEGANEDNDNA